MQFHLDGKRLKVGPVAIPMHVLEALGRALSVDESRKRVVFTIDDSGKKGATVTQFSCESAPEPVLPSPALCSKCLLPEHAGFCWQAKRFVRRKN